MSLNMSLEPPTNLEMSAAIGNLIPDGEAFAEASDEFWKELARITIEERGLNEG